LRRVENTNEIVYNLKSISAQEDEPATVGKKLKEKLDRILEKIADAIDHGKIAKEELLERVKNVRTKIKEMQNGT